MSLPEMEPSSARGSIVGTLRAFSNGQRDSKNPRAYAELEDDDDVLPPPPPPPGAPPPLADDVEYDEYDELLDDDEDDDGDAPPPPPPAPPLARLPPARAATAGAPLLGDRPAAQAHRRSRSDGAPAAADAPASAPLAPLGRERAATAASGGSGRLGRDRRDSKTSLLSWDAGSEGGLSGTSTQMSDRAKKLREFGVNKLKEAGVLTPGTIRKAREMWKEIRPHAEDALAATQQAAGAHLHSMASHELERALQMAGGKVKEGLVDDDDMPMWARRWMERIADLMWPEVHREIKDGVLQELGHVLKQYAAPIDEEPPIQWYPSPVAYLRARFLYNIYPYDQSIWQMLANWKWCAAFIWSMWPLYGVQPLYWMLVFACFDRSDEYQLVNFILEFKALMFLSIGFVCLGMGAMQDHFCITWSAHEHYCDTIGPGASPTFLWEAFWFVVQITNVWLAFLYLPYSNNLAGGPVGKSLAAKKGLKSGRIDLIDLEAGGGGGSGDGGAADSAEPSEGGTPRTPHTPGTGRRKGPSSCYGRTVDLVMRRLFGFEDGDFSRGGAMWPWLVYDAWCLFFCLFWVASSAVWHGVGTDRFWEEEWQFRATIWWCKAAYGLLSMPFIIFFLPGLGAALTHVRPTGYNKNGKCMRKLTGSQRKQKKAAAAAAASAHREEQERVLAELADRRSARRSEPVRDPDAPPPRPRRCSTEPALATAERSRSDPSRSRSHRPTREVPPAAEPQDSRREHRRIRSATVAEPYARSAKL